MRIGEREELELPTPREAYARAAQCSYSKAFLVANDGQPSTPTKFNFVELTLSSVIVVVVVGFAQLSFKTRLTMSCVQQGMN